MWVNNFSKIFQNTTEIMTSQNEVQQKLRLCFENSYKDIF